MKTTRAFVVPAFCLLGLMVCGCAVEQQRRGTSGRVWTSGAPPEFVFPPRATFDGDAVKIQFWVSRATDVAVLVKNSDGRVVRHLAAGVLGPNAPAPLAPNSLAQSLTWDGRDDAGRCLPPGRYRVQVNLGLTVTYDRALGWNPRALGTVHGLALGPNNTLYVMSETGRDYLDGQFQIFTTDGEYVRTIMPRPANIPLDRARPLGEMVLATGERFPTSLLPQYGKRRHQVPIVTPEGDLIFTNGPTGGHLEGQRFSSVPWRGRLSRRLLRIAADGGAPKAGHLGPILAPGSEQALFSLAMGPDGMIYVSGARHAVFRVRWGENETPQHFAGTPDKAGGGATGLKNPCGIAFDGRGNLYVADRGNHRIAVFDSAGRFKSEIPLQWPRQIVVHKGTGAIYATSGHRRHRLVKFVGNRRVASCDLRSGWPFIALDPRPGRPVLYVANVDSSDPRASRRTKVLVRLIDTGGELRFDRELSDNARPRQPLLAGVDRERELVYGMWPRGNYWRMNGRTGEVEVFDILLAAKANGISEISVGPDGTVLVHVTGELGRLDHHLMPLPFSATGTYIVNFPREDCLRSFYARGCSVAPNGDIHWIYERGGYARPMRCAAIYADGTLKRDSLVVFESGSPAGVRSDRQGNVYVIDHLKPLDKIVPDVFRGRVELRRSNRYVHGYGSLLKFGPRGGRVRHVGKGAPKRRALRPGQKQFTAAEGRGDFIVDGALWSYFGVSIIRPSRPRDGCSCWTPRFDVDDFARVFVPDQLRSRVVVLDTNGNEIMTFGRYGNVDDRGPGIPLADPRTVMVSREAVYIGDMTNQRVVRATLTYQRSAGSYVRLPRRTLSRLTREFARKHMLPERRQTLRLMNAEMRVDDLREEAVKLSPSLARGLDWDALVLKVAAHAAGALSNAEDARAVLSVTAPREVSDWPHDEARALLGKYLDEGNLGLRLAVCWGLWGGKFGPTGRELLYTALKDRSELVQVTAAYVLLQQKDPAGVGKLFTGALSKDPNVYKMAETAIIKYASTADFPLGKREVEALSTLLGKTRLTDKKTRNRHWFLRRAALLMLPLSDDPEGAITSLLDELQTNTRLTGNNLNRVIRGLGRLRSIAAVPELLKFLERGRRPNWRGGHGDRAEIFAAGALALIADPKSVPRIIELLDGKNPATPQQAERALSLMFDPALPSGSRVLPRAGKLVRVTEDRLPEPKALRAAWSAFWKADGERYERDPDNPALRRKGAE